MDVLIMPGIILVSSFLMNSMSTNSVSHTTITRHDIDEKGMPAGRDESSQPVETRDMCLSKSHESTRIHTSTSVQNNIDDTQSIDPSNHQNQTNFKAIPRIGVGDEIVDNHKTQDENMTDFTPDLSVQEQKNVDLKATLRAAEIRVSELRIRNTTYVSELTIAQSENARLNSAVAELESQHTENMDALKSKLDTLRTTYEETVLEHEKKTLELEQDHKRQMVRIKTNHDEKNAPLLAKIQSSQIDLSKIQDEWNDWKERPVSNAYTKKQLKECLADRKLLNTTHAKHTRLDIIRARLNKLSAIRNTKRHTMGMRDMKFSQQETDDVLKYISVDETDYLPTTVGNTFSKSIIDQIRGTNMVHNWTDIADLRDYLRKFTLDMDSDSETYKSNIMHNDQFATGVLEDISPNVEENPNKSYESDSDSD
jgi:hypothetical protein